MNSLIIAASPSFAERERIQEFISGLPEVTYWFACMPQMIFCTTPLSARELAAKLESQFGTIGRYLVMQVHEDRQGRLPQKAWHLFRNPDNPRLKED
jgi:hypothetical protein